MFDGSIFFWLLLVPIGFITLIVFFTISDQLGNNVKQDNQVISRIIKKEWAEVKGKNGSTTYIYQYAESKGIVGKITLQDDGLWRAEVDLSRKDFVSLSDAKQAVEQVTK